MLDSARRSRAIRAVYNKEHLMHLFGLALAAFSWVALAVEAAPAPDASPLKPGQARGKLTVNGESVEFTHAYLTKETTSGGPGLVITVANAPLAPELRNQALMFEKREPVKQGKLYLMNIKVDMKKQVYSCDIYHRRLGPMQHTSITGVHTFEATELSPTRVKGRSFMKQPWKSTDGDQEIFYDVSFDAAP